MNDTSYSSQKIQTNGICLHVVTAGPSDGPLVILLHGFPEFWYGWRRQIDALAHAGYRVLAPDQRGYNLSDKPKSIGAYRLDELAKDIVGLIEAEGRERACIVGHDWGGAVAWWLALKHAPRVEKLAVLNAPHPLVMRRHLFGSKEQRRKSWYFFFFQIPFLPEARMRKDDWRIGAKALQATSRPGAFSEEDLQHYRAAWSQPGADRGMINWYRASLQRMPRMNFNPRVSPPTLLLWGMKDRFLIRAMAQASIRLCERGKSVLFEEASHWVQHEEAERVNELLLEFLQS